MMVSRRLPVCGTFSINAETDASTLVAPLDFAQEVLQRPDEVSRIELVPESGWSAQELRQSLDARWPELRTRTRREKNALIHATSRAEKWATFAILSFILVVAAFNILAALTMLLLDKRRDIGTLTAIGMTGREIRQVFSWQGLLINALGAAAGIGIGMALVVLQDRVWPGAPGGGDGARLSGFSASARRPRGGARRARGRRHVQCGHGRVPRATDGARCGLISRHGPDWSRRIG